MNPLALGGVRTGLSGTGSSTPNPKLVSAAHEFEAQMMKELLKPMTSSDGLTGSEDEENSLGSTGALGDFASEALGKGLSERGGLGIAKSILSHLSQTGSQSNAGASPSTSVGALKTSFHK